MISNHENNIDAIKSLFSCSCLLKIDCTYNAYFIIIVKRWYYKKNWRGKKNEKSKKSFF